MEFIDLKAQYRYLKNEIDENIQNVLNHGNYIMGEEVRVLEKKLAEYVGVKYCVTCANGTDALSLALMAWDIQRGDAVFVPSFTFYSTSEVVSAIGATPIFVDIIEETFNMDPEKLEEAILNIQKEGKLKPRVIIPVDLFGLPADYRMIKPIAEKYELLVLEDAAQGFGGEINNQKAGSFGDISTTSFFPAKPLGCYGDGGALFTNTKEYYDLLISLRVHGKGRFKYDNVRVGMNSRLDTIQAAVLLPKLKAFEDYEINKRNEFALKYTQQLSSIVKTPFIPEGMKSSWAQYTIKLKDEKERDMLLSKLKHKGIPTMIYYPKPLHLQTVYQCFHVHDLTVSEEVSKRVLSLPMHPYLDDESINLICDGIKEVLEEK